MYEVLIFWEGFIDLKMLWRKGSFFGVMVNFFIVLLFMLNNILDCILVLLKIIVLNLRGLGLFFFFWIFENLVYFKNFFVMVFLFNFVFVLLDLISFLICCL